jgi:hypothetical protein
MKIRLLTVAVAVAAFVLTSGTAEAARLFYRRAVPVRVHVGRPVIVAPVYPVVTPMTTTVVTPNVVIGPRGRVRFVAPVRRIGVPVYLR